MERTRADGSVSYTAQVTRKKGGRIVFRKSQTFNSKAMAKRWITKLEKETATDEGLSAARSKSGGRTVGEAIDLYTEFMTGQMGDTKAQVLRTLRTLPVADMPAGDFNSQQVVALARSLRNGDGVKLDRNYKHGEQRSPQTVQNYLSHLGAVIRVSRSAWGFEFDRNQFQDGMEAAKSLKLVGKSGTRERRITVEEMDLFMNHFYASERAYPQSAPMSKLAAFGLFSARRIDEICRIKWSDLDGDRVLVRDMKHPGQKLGNDVWCELLPEAQRIIAAMPRDDERIFPFNTESMSARFTRAKKALGLWDDEQLVFHSLRHECASRLAEMGRTVPQIAMVTGHKSWQSLQRYSHLRAIGDKWADWPWLDVIAPQ